jgi:hypothetical protein
MFWWYLMVGIGQMLVCLMFGEVVSQFPISGGLYPWARRLVGKRWAWMAGWIYGLGPVCVDRGRRDRAARRSSRNCSASRSHPSITTCQSRSR